MMNNSADIEKIASLPLVQRLPRELQAPLAALLLDIAELRACEPDDVLIREREIGGSNGFLLLDGQLQVQRGDAKPVAIAAPALVGEMYQFNPFAERSATVTVASKARVLVFSWQELYAQARARFPEEHQTQLLESLEHLVWERVDSVGFLALPLFEGLSEAVRVKACMLLLWLGRPKSLHKGEKLFEQDTLSGNMGFLLLRGNLVLTAGNQRVLSATAPNVVGVSTVFRPDARWTATASAAADTEVLVFSWMDYLKRLEPRLAPAEYGSFVRALETNAGKHYCG